MILYQKLQKATSEEDVKDAYIKALGLKEYQKNLDKGTPVNIEGKISYRMYVDKDGVSRFYTEVVASILVALPKKEKEIITHKLAA